MSDLLFRPGTDADAALLLLASRMANSFGWRKLLDEREACVVESLPEDPQMAVIATDGEGTEVGAAWCYTDPDPFFADADGCPVPELTLAVLPEYRGRGTGGQLIEQVAIRAVADSYRWLALNVDAPNPAARLYSRHQFRLAGVGARRDCVAMLRALTSSPGAVTRVDGRQPTRSSSSSQSRSSVLLLLSAAA